jgi:cytidine deaminase
MLMTTEQYADLVQAAKQAYHRAYAPYSKFKVGAAALTHSNEIVNGCNVENASYGLTVCAERNCLGHGVVKGHTQFDVLVVYTETEQLTPPCGACRQVIAEFMSQSSTVIAVNHLDQEIRWQVSDLLPDAFLPEQLLGQ